MGIRVLIVGGGGREDALSWRVARSPSVEAVFAAPGNAGTALRGDNWEIAPTDGKALAQRALAERIDLVVLGPETAIAAGVGDRLRDAGLAVFGPNRSGGRLESSKIFAKRFLERHDVPTANARVAHSLPQALAAIDQWAELGIVVKADGLAAGKGVVVVPDSKTAGALVADWYANATIPGGGSDVLLEELLLGRELSVFALCDGRAMFPFSAACDYKRAGDGDKGPNTGGMGAYSPPAGFPTGYLEAVRERVVAPTLRGLLAEGENYVGVLYCGLMWTEDGPKVLEFNVRFGDPETQAMMPRVQGDFARLLYSAASGALEADAATFMPDPCVCVTLTTPEYPLTSAALKGLPADLDPGEGSTAFWGASARRGDTIDSAGGRVLTIAATGSDLPTARAQAYDGVRRVVERLGGNIRLAFRTDIAGNV